MEQEQNKLPNENEKGRTPNSEHEIHSAWDTFSSQKTEISPFDLPFSDEEGEPDGFRETADEHGEPTDGDISHDLTAEELALFRAGMARAEDRSKLPPHDTSGRAHLARYAKKNKIFSISALVIAAALTFGMVLGAIMGISWFVNRPNTSDFTVKLGEKDKKPETLSYTNAVRDGVFYVNLCAIAEYAGMTISGSHQKMQFAASTESYLQFEHGSEIAVINGQEVEMSVSRLHAEKNEEPVLAKAYIEDGNCMVPYEVLTKSVSEGLLFRLDKKTNTLTVKRLYTEDPNDEDIVHEVDILFRTDNFTLVTAPAEKPKYEYFYTIDITPYLDAITSENLLLANKQNPLGSDYKPDVTDLTCKTDGDTQRLQVNAASALYAMMAEMAADGVTDCFVTSSYRTYLNQNWLYYSYYYDKEKNRHPDWTDDQIYAEISTYSSRPGESEHQTGLCVDFSANAIGGNLNNTFAETDAFAWLIQNAYRFGFILRYPEDKVDITGYSYESWHFRFVGRDAATEIFYADQCLEEYLSALAE